MEEEINDLAMQTGWNQLFQQFVSDLFIEFDKPAPNLSIAEMKREGETVGNILTILKNNIDFVRSKYARNFIPVTHLSETNHLSVLGEGLALYLRSVLSSPQFDALSTQISASAEHYLFSILQNNFKLYNHNQSNKVDHHQNNSDDDDDDDHLNSGQINHSDDDDDDEDDLNDENDGDDKKNKIINHEIINQNNNNNNNNEKEKKKKKKEMKGIFSLNESNALINVCKIALFSKYANYESDAYFAFKGKQPIIYYTNNSFMIDDQFHHQLALPKSSFIHVHHHDHFIQLLSEHSTSEVHDPLMLITHSGSGYYDDLSLFHATAKRYSLWTHVFGEDMALLLTEMPERMKAVTEYQSITITPGEWYGLATPSCFTILKEGLPASWKDHHHHNKGDDMLALPLWIVLQFVGVDQLISILQQARHLSKELHNSLKDNASIIFYTPPDDPLTVIFRYCPITKPERVYHLDFLNNLNTQVLIDMTETASKLGLDITSIDKFTCIRFRPLYFYHLMGITQNEIIKFSEMLVAIVNCINATLSCSTAFEEAIQSCEGLHCVHVRNFVGIGAVRYLPPFFRGSELSVDIAEEINNLNHSLAEKLASIDPLFSVGKTVEGQICICLGVETKPITNQSPYLYAKLILDTMKSMDVFHKVQQKIEAIILKGIKDAEKEIIKEVEKEEQQKGLFRQIPLVSSVVNWWSPIKSSTPGKSFDILTTQLKPSPSPVKKVRNLNESQEFDVPTEPLPEEIITSASLNLTPN